MWCPAHRSASQYQQKTHSSPTPDVVYVRKNQVEKHFGVGFYVLMHLDFVFRIDDANVHFAGMQIDPAVVFMLLFVKSHRLASFRFGRFLLAVTILYRCE